MPIWYLFLKLEFSKWLFKRELKKKNKSTQGKLNFDYPKSLKIQVLHSLFQFPFSLESMIFNIH